MSFTTLDLHSSSLAVLLARSGHYQLCPGMPLAGVGIDKLQMASKGEQTVMVNGFISNINMMRITELQCRSP